ncbi:malate synthase [Shewanella sp. NIFS-20-20]|uniref:malate synthase n=1 Tax=Shewanella sp. NIFS-20-20 TaxID=2853806 RepID=UPI001C46A3C8|nr:malate synthase [Shewanella sp. NIFS-20-20]MBV7314590.1 malate synthase [Shewanella sp. NIFS-20-20]
MVTTTIAPTQTRTPSHTSGQQYVTSQDKLAEAKAFLDVHCPLTRGSHQQVVSYLVYYQHLLAFFADGSHCGLASAQQFVGLCGHKEAPSAILLKTGAVHVELSFDRKGLIGQSDLAHIEDIQLQTRVGNGFDIWVSLLHGQTNMQGEKPTAKHYTAKDGNDYRFE